MKLSPSIRQLQIGIAIGLILAVWGLSLNNPIVGWLGVILVLLFGRFYIVFKEEGDFNSTFSSGLWSTVFLTLLLVWIANFFIVTIEKVGFASPLAILIILLGLSIIVGLHFIVDRLYSRRVHAYMAQKIPAEQIDTDDGTVVEEKPSTTSPPATELVFRTFGIGDKIPRLSEESKAFYKRALNEGGRQLFNGLLIALLVNFLVSVGIFTYLFSLGETIKEHSIRPILTGMVFHTPAFLLALAATVYVNYRLAGVNSVLAILMGFLVNLGNFIGITSEGGPSTEINVLGISLETLLWVPLVLYFLIVLPQLGLYFWKNGTLPGSRFLSRGKGVRLLILRVFGVDQNTYSLFSKLGRRWQHVGPLLTIVDPTYARFELNEGRLSFIFVSLAPVLFILGISMFDLEFLLSMLMAAPFIFLFFYFPLWIFYLRRQFASIKDRFAQNMAALDRRIEFESTADSILSGRYQQGTLFCYDNLWRLALRKLVAGADYILMDLRGFSATNKGCEYEISFLLNQFPLQRVIFLTDNSTDRPLFETYAKSEWKKIKPDSPNRSSEQPTLTVYDTMEKTERDVERIIGIFSSIMTPQPVAKTEEEPIDYAALMEGGQYEKILNTRNVNIGILIGWCVIAIGVVLTMVYQQDGMYITSGMSITWLGIIVLMLFRRVKKLFQRDGHLKGMFKGNWGLLFWFVAGMWFFLYVIVNVQN